MKEFTGFMHGVNLGGWFSQCNYTEERYNNFITKDDFALIKSWGLDHIRLPVDYNLVEEADGAYKESGFEHIANAISWCRDNNLNIILDLHKTAGYSFDLAHKESGFFDNAGLQERFYRLWENFARRFATAMDGTANEICFELLNEVTDQSFCKKWNEIANTCIKRIRAIAPSIKILVGSYWNNSLASVKDLDPPYDQNIVYNFHCYDPLVFTHQGATWIPKMNADFQFPLKSKYCDYAKMMEEKCGQAGTTFDAFAPDATLDQNYFETIFAEAVQIAEERGVMLYCGEYGVIEKANIHDTLEWYRLISNCFNRHGIGRAAWSFRQMDFGLSDARLDSVRDELVRYL